MSAPPLDIMDRAILIIKHDALQRALAAKVIKRVERRGLAISGMRMLVPTQQQVEQLLAGYKDRPFYHKLAQAYLGKPAIIVMLSGRDAVRALQHTVGSPNPHNAAPGSIRGDFALSATSNCVHVAQTVEQAERELRIFFGPNELEGPCQTAASRAAHE